MSDVSQNSAANLAETGEVTLSAPCKVNLTLDIFPPRPDGYHDLDSVVAKFDYPADIVKVSVRPGPSRILLLCKDKSLPRDERNLAVRAAQIYREAFPMSSENTLYIRLEKRLPQQAGLGGGSSDAAAVLRAMQTLFGAASEDKLREVAAGIGSDVPLFLVDGMVRMQGRGEQVTPLSGELPQQPVLHGILVKPDVGVPTPAAYAALDSLAGRQPGEATARMREVLHQGTGVEEIAEAMGNDFEPVILPRYPEIAAAHRAVREAGALRALLCGSGASVFGLARDREHARELARQLAGKFPFVKIATSSE
ncbi:MAG: 4-(cytidine 5'-diphospho)-2-C-methyl-D-erythritol kinase [Armatimonadaceae bacterium]